MKFKNLLMVTVFVMLGLSARASDKNILHVEIRSPKSVLFDTNTDLQFVTDTTSEGGLLIRIKQRDDDDFRVFQKSYNLLTSERRRALIIYTHSLPKNQPEHVFLLSIPRKPKPAGWTNWQHADYAETNAGWNFIRGYKSADRSTNVPPNSFELRYKVE